MLVQTQADEVSQAQWDLGQDLDRDGAQHQSGGLARRRRPQLPRRPQQGSRQQQEGSLVGRRHRSANAGLVLPGHALVLQLNLSPPLPDPGDAFRGQPHVVLGDDAQHLADVVASGGRLAASSLVEKAHDGAGVVERLRRGWPAR